MALEMTLTQLLNLIVNDLKEHGIDTTEFEKKHKAKIAQLEAQA